jgi:thiol-disulfide isomerase/thioredoxin
MSIDPAPTPVPSSSGRKLFLRFVFFGTIILGYLLLWNAGRVEPAPLNTRPPAVLSEAGQKLVVNDFSAALLKEALAASDEKPLVLFIYTSWCPYCHRMFPMVNEAANAEDIRFLAISIDSDRAALANYLAEFQSLNLAPYVITETADKRAFAQVLWDQDLKFRGGIPYIAVFQQGKPVVEIPGALEKADFDGMLADVRDAAKGTR